MEEIACIVGCERYSELSFQKCGYFPHFSTKQQYQIFAVKKAAGLIIFK